MKFFKHFVDAHSGASLESLYEKMGHTGLSCYWILVEICAAKLNIQRGKYVSVLDCTFDFHPRTLRDKLRLSATNVGRFLDHCQTLGLLSYSHGDTSILIALPKLLECLDRDAKIARKLDEVRALDEDEDKDEDKDKDKDKELGKPAAKKPTATVKGKIDFEVIEELKGDPTLDEVLGHISTKTQKTWLQRYKDSEWVKQTLLKAIDYYQTKANQNNEQVDEWGLKLTTWLARDKNRPTLTKDPFDFNYEQRGE